MRIREPFACQGERPQKQPQGEQISVVYSFQLAIVGFSRLRKQTWETNTGLLLLVMLGMKPGPWVSEQARVTTEPHPSPWTRSFHWVMMLLLALSDHGAKTSKDSAALTLHVTKRKLEPEVLADSVPRLRVGPVTAPSSPGPQKAHHVSPLLPCPRLLHWLRQAPRCVLLSRHPA